MNRYNSERNLQFISSDEDEDDDDKVVLPEYVNELKNIKK